MSNQLKDIAEKGFARHGYPVGIPPKTLQQIEEIMTEVAADMNNLDYWRLPMSELFTMPLQQYEHLRYSCCLVDSQLSDFPEELKETDKKAYLFTNRDDQNGIQQLIGAVSGHQYSRSIASGKITSWASTQGDSIHYATFDINVETGELTMHTNPGYTGANFTLDEETGELLITI